MTLTSRCRGFYYNFEVTFLSAVNPQFHLINVTSVTSVTYRNVVSKGF